ncbi:MAG TPA: ABC transporter ATP-binding protein [Clostridiales bacterium]|nr:ABC transporter ATP-binding protein [Clostridiales bacterium]
MSKLRTLLKALIVSVKIKGAFSMVISLLGFAVAFFPVIIAQQLRALTDSLQSLVGTGGSAGPSLVIFTGVVGLYMVQVIITNIQQYTNGLDEVKIQRYIKRTIMRHKCEVRYKYIENYDDFQKRLTFIEEYAGYHMAKCIGNMITILQLIIAFIVASLALWKINPYIVLILFVTSIPAALLSYFQQDETFRYRAKWTEEGALAIHYFATIGGAGYSYAGLQEIRHFGLFDYLKARWRSIADEYISKKNKIMYKHVKFNTAADFLRSVVYLGILLIAAWSIYDNPAIGLGAFTLVFALSGQLQTSTGDCLVSIMVLAQNIPYMKEFFYLDDIEREPQVGKTTCAADGNIEFNDVSFAYPNTDVDVIKNITVQIKEGEKVAIVGENGSGKSTFISLLCGMFDSKSGRISVGGIDIKSNPVAARNTVSVVFQDFARYESSIRENITVSDKNRMATDEEIMELLRKINVDDVVKEQKNGLHELVGSFSEKANNLSGGQWQKISIARAAYRNKAKVMILDEPTSALDPLAEAQLYRNFASLTEDKTTILISHRLGITAIVDRILVFKDGRIVEDGSHKQLMAMNGHYAEMYRAQAQWYA